MPASSDRREVARRPRGCDRQPTQVCDDRGSSSGGRESQSPAVESMQPRGETVAIGAEGQGLGASGLAVEGNDRLVATPQTRCSPDSSNWPPADTAGRTPSRSNANDLELSLVVASIGAAYHNTCSFDQALCRDNKTMARKRSVPTADQNDIPVPPGVILRRVIRDEYLSDVTCLSWSPDGQVLASGSFNETVGLWGADGRRLATLEGHRGGAFSVAWSPDGRVLASGSADRTVRLWGADGRRLGTLEGHGGQVYSVAWSPDGRVLASGSF